MSTAVTCEQCDQRFAAAEHLYGRSVPCPPAFSGVQFIDTELASIEAGRTKYCGLFEKGTLRCMDSE